MGRETTYWTVIAILLTACQAPDANIGVTQPIRESANLFCAQLLECKADDFMVHFASISECVDEVLLRSRRSAEAAQNHGACIAAISEYHRCVSDTTCSHVPGPTCIDETAWYREGCHP